MVLILSNSNWERAFSGYTFMGTIAANLAKKKH
jgi:hypothetical protein